MDNVADLTIADVREEMEYITGHLENAINLPLTELIDVEKTEGAAFAESMIPDKTAPLIVYCRSGKRGAMAAQALVGFGYRSIFLLGALPGWPYGLFYD